MTKLAKNRTKSQKKPKWQLLKAKAIQTIKSPMKLYELINEILFNPDYLFLVTCILIPIELILNVLIVLKVPYTEIDWKAYMQEVEGFINGTYNYYELKGDTGPLVYPAGFVYLYTALYWVTHQGTNIRLAQYIYVIFYILFISIVFTIYNTTKKVAPIALIIMSLTSHRIHSIFVLRLFNDPLAMLFLYASIICFLKKNWTFGCILFSLGVSIKMNVLLFAPGLFIILCLSHGFLQTLKYIFICGLVQLVVGAPFLLTYPVAYLHRSFELGRQFFYKWTVNWKCVPEDLFLFKPFQTCLLVLHLCILLIFMNRILKNVGGLKNLFFQKKRLKLSYEAITYIMFVSNFIGICFSRSLHYQFYVWYYHSLAFLLWNTEYQTSLKILLLGLIEFSWNVYPSTFNSSLILNLSHVVVLVGIGHSLFKKNDPLLN
ncbi:dol-P-Man:Man(5) c(2)-PP-Dol alpha-1-3-mannosyltransferase-like [Brachionus plicatilis]|uniref:dolichyl-P-Man:Man5GlcNAc2-PP-dolichol alpha-1,3-mannosyltransferase n=1 Tax=Brachionus plicatilis TaxID=10195 RepID=A0A3M7T1U4_BRAPC|nr:dol-P-Man:Man(5) c(2)-PP-Dol alpha-1-3-mannosyltransferase-like [Brachionus plicatilis]